LSEKVNTALAIIPARGGSKGIPRKNVHPLAGKPLIAHTIEQARQACSVDRVVVSTDDTEIAAISEQYGAEVVWRPAEISGDNAASESALLHALEYLQQAESYEPELLVFLQCTSPLTLAEDIDAAVQTLVGEDADSALAVTPFHYFLWRRDENGDVVGVNHDKRVRPLRQGREPQFLETGAVYVMRTKGFREAKHRFFGKTAMYVMPPERCLELDEPVDFQIAEMLMRKRQKGQNPGLSFCSIAMLVLDFDGVMTDNRVLVDQHGREAVLCHRGDGWGIARLKEAGVEVIVLSTETNPVVAARCEKLGVSCLQGARDKLTALQAFAQERSLTPQQVAYVGNDINDLDCMGWVGLPIAVADAVPEIQATAQLVTILPGGEGAVREVCDLILSQRRGEVYGQARENWESPCR
jgi:N-acylneuraminate cytidylyltransferase